MIRVATAGWAIPRAVADRFGADGSTLQRYAGRFTAAEINSTFYRTHKPATFARWSQATPPGFQFAVKAPKAISHERRLVGCADLLAGFLDSVGHLGDKLGPILVQLPPSLVFDRAVAEAFIAELRRGHDGLVAWEARHPTWFSAEVDGVLEQARIARVAADPAVVPRGASPGGWSGLAYWRLHGSPRPYYSWYEPASNTEFARQIANCLATDIWCVFDNTALGGAAANALQLTDILSA